MSDLVFENSKIDREPFRVNLDDARYPNRVKVIMGKNAPKHLDMVGNIKLLDMAGLGVCGSRHATYKSLEIAQDCAEQAAQNNVSVVSGNAAGVDLKSHFNCLKAGGETILVIPEGMNHFRIRKDLQPVWDWERVLVVSQFNADDHWGKYRAMKRNQLVLALSRVMIVVESGEKGGSLNTGKEALKYDIPLYVTQHQDMFAAAPGNQILLDMGARKLSKSRSSNKANLTEVFKSVEEDEVLGNFSGKPMKFKLRPTVPRQ